MKRGRKATKVSILDQLNNMPDSYFKKYSREEVYNEIKFSNAFIGKVTKTKAREMIMHAIKELNRKKLSPEEREFSRAVEELNDSMDKRHYNRKKGMFFHECDINIGQAFGGESRLVGYYAGHDINENNWYKRVIVKIMTRYNDSSSWIPHYEEMSEAELSQILG